MKKLIAVEDLETGMETAAAVLNKFGQVLLVQNSKIETKHITILKTWGIKTIEVIDYAAAGISNEIDESLLAKLRTDLLSGLGWIPKNPNEEDLINMAVQKIYELQNPGGNN